MLMKLLSLVQNEFLNLMIIYTYKSKLSLKTGFKDFLIVFVFFLLALSGSGSILILT